MSAVRGAAAVGAFLVACGARTPLSYSTSTDAAGLTDASSPRDGAVVGEDGGSSCVPVQPSGGTCNSLSPSGSPVPSVCVHDPTPSPSGGTIVDGTYVLASSRYYGGCPTTELDRIVWNVCSSSWATVQEVTMSNGVQVKTIDATADVNPSNATVGLTLTCAPNATPDARFGYDATPVRLTLYIYDYGPGIVRVDQLVRQ